MTYSVVQGFSKSLAMTVLSEIGDKTFFAAASLMRASAGWSSTFPSLISLIAIPESVSTSRCGILRFEASINPSRIADNSAILAMRHPRRLVLAGCLSALIVMTILSALVGWAAPNLIPHKFTHHITTLLFFGFGLWSLWDAFKDGDAEELAEVEAELDADLKKANGTAKENSKADEDLKQKTRPFLTQFFSPILLKAFSITFFGEWGDKSQIATIGLAAYENPFGVVLGGILGQALCTTAAVLGGKSLAKQISEKLIALSGGVLFIVFGVQSFLSAVES